jgi:hypothetical protein
MTTATPTPLVDATIIRQHLTEANLSQRSAARLESTSAPCVAIAPATCPYLPT